jgi:hypothetical protein
VGTTIPFSLDAVGVTIRVHGGQDVPVQVLTLSTGYLSTAFLFQINVGLHKDMLNMHSCFGDKFKIMQTVTVAQVRYAPNSHPPGLGIRD